MLKLKCHKANMTEVIIGKISFLFSYETPVAAHVEGKGFYRTSECHSNTTQRHINAWFAKEGASTWKEQPQEWFNGFISMMIP